MKRIFLSLLLVLAFSSLAQAKLVYVRDGGGSAAQCTGLTNAVYPGTGTNQNCAFNRPFIALGYCTGNEASGAPCQFQGILSPGDTLFIDGDSDLHSGQQAQYEMGYDDTGAGLTPGCSTSYPYSCTANNLPSGNSASAPTSVIGTGTHKPQLWGTQRTAQVLSAYGSYITLQNIEITDHQACAYNDPGALCNYEGPYPWGPWALDGIVWGNGTGFVMTDVYIHGVGRYGINTPDWITSTGSATFTRVWVIGNGYGGYTSGVNNAYTGTITWNQPVVEWNGCSEAYPLTGGIDNPSNYSQCFGQNSGGYGDGIAFGPNGEQNGGSWNIYGPGSISFNTQDGFDTLHGTGTGTIQVDKMRFEGNAGQQLKLNATNEYLTNSLVIGDCGWWYQSPQAYSGFAIGDVCRPASNATMKFNVTNNSITNIFNDTFVSNANVALESNDQTGNGCNGATVINFKNNVFLAGYNWQDDQSFAGSGAGNSLTTYFYRDGPGDGSSAGCANVSWIEDYNIITGGRANSVGGCLGAHDKCVAPGFSGTIPMGTAGGGESTYYQGQSAITLVPLSNSSPAIGAGTTGLSYWNNSNDFYNVTRPSPPAMGGLEPASCAVGAYFCQFNSSCCGGACTNNSCGTCSANGTACTTGATCCSNTCTSGTCQNFVAVCGDGIVTQPPEACDISGPNLNGMTCANFGYLSGTLGCSPGCASFNTSGCMTPIPIIVQHAGNFGSGVTGTDTIGSTGSGHLLIAFVSAGQGTVGVSDGTNAFTKFPGTPITGGAMTVWYLPSSSSGKTTITATFSATSNYEIEVWEVSNMTSPVPDVVAGIVSATQSGGTATGASLSIANVPEFLVAGDSTTGGSSNPNFNSGGDTFNGDSYSSLITTSTGTYTPIWSDNGTSFHTLTAAFKNNTGSCTTNGGMCSSNPNCCSGLCSLSSCVSCVVTGNSCSLNSDCCSGDCSGSVCINPAPPSNGIMTLISGSNTRISGTSQL